MLTVELLQEMAPGEIFSRGIFKDDHIGINFMWSGLLLKWIACRGQGYHDWAIYIGSLGDSEDYIQSGGDKLGNIDSITRLVSCDVDALKLYRM